MSEFQQPGAGGDSFSPKDHPEWAGALFLFLPTEYIQSISTSNGDTDAVRANAVILATGPQHGSQPLNPPVKLDNTIVFPRALVGSLKGSIGGMVLGHLAQGENKKGSPPWILTDHTPEDAALATQYLAQNPIVSQPNPPAATAPAPSAGGWGAAPRPTEDPWAGMATAAGTAGWGAAPAPTPPAPVDPNALQAFLVTKGVNPAQVPSAEAALTLARTYPDWTEAPF